MKNFGAKSLEYKVTIDVGIGREEEKKVVTQRLIERVTIMMIVGRKIFFLIDPRIEAVKPTFRPGKKNYSTREVRSQ